MHKDNISITSKITIKVYDAKTKELIDIRHCKNNLVNNGFRVIRAWLGNVTPLDDPDWNVDIRITHIAIGTSPQTENPSQTSLVNEILRKELYPNPDTNCKITLGGGSSYNEVTYTIFIDESEANGEVIQEIGIFSETFGNNVMISRALCGYLQKTAEMQFEIDYTYIISNG